MEIVVSGTDDLLERFLSDIVIGPKGSSVSNVQSSQHPSGEELPFPFAILR